MKKLYVGNLSFQTSEQELREWFSKAGFQVENINLIRDSYTDRLRGFGFVEISNDDEAARAIQELNGKEFLGRSVVVNEARPPREREGGGRDRSPGRGRPRRGPRW
ncbi:MAG: RNA-binding protein [Acidobacteria bacterium]|nr:RNA-binding protein [Acidobacteriota bacterium]